MKSNLSKAGLILMGGFLGGLTSHLFSPTPVQAYGAQQVVQAKRFELVDDNGRLLATWGLTGEGSGGMWFFDKNGKARLNVGTYGDGHPMVVLLEPNGNAKGLFRTAGAGNAPVVVLKNQGQDRVILGMDLPTGNQGGLMYIDEKGQRRDVFGKFQM